MIRTSTILPTIRISWDESSTFISAKKKDNSVKKQELSFFGKTVKNC